MTKAFSSVFTLALLALLSLSSFAQQGPAAEAAPTSPTAFEHIKIGNFGQMDAGYYRGAQPAPDDYKSLAEIGVKTVIDLRNDPQDYARSSAEAAGLKYVAIPMSGWKTPKDSDIERFLSVANDPETGVFFVHCKAGIHRTGITAAIYRMRKYGWDYDTSYKEMKNYNFSSGLVHGALKKYVKRYAARLEAEKAAAAAASSGAALVAGGGTADTSKAN